MTTIESTPVPGWPLAPGPRTESAGRWSLRRWLLVVGAITLLFAILAVASGSIGLARMTDARAVVLDEVQPALLASQDLSTALLNQESGVRGYLLTGHDDFLTPYRDGIEGERRAAAELRRLAEGGHLGNLLDELDFVQTAAQSWRTDFADPSIAGVREGGSDATAVDATFGKARFDQVRAELVTMDGNVGDILTQATDRLRREAEILRWVFIMIGIGLASLILTVGIWLRRAVTMPLSRLAAEVRQVVSGNAHREVLGRGPREVVMLAHDIDAMRQHILAELDALELAHRRLDEQARDLERSNRDLEQFAYVASHDLQEPLRKVSSFCQLLQRRYSGQLDERGESYIEFAVDGARRMQQLINDLLAFSRVGRLFAGFEAVDLRRVVDLATNQLSTAIDETGAVVTVDELPSVDGDSSLLVQLMANLIGNALKFRRPGIPPQVTIGALPHDDGWEIWVADNGIGVEPEYADKVFVIFQRLHSRDDYPGTGIGLAMAKKIVEHHGGRIWIDPDRTDGATVRFTLRVEPAPDDGASDDAVDNLSAAGSPGAVDGNPAHGPADPEERAE